MLPTWSRYSVPEESILSEASILLVDGLISYFGQVVLGQEPHARWRLGFDPRNRNYAYQNEPVLAVDADERGQREIGVWLILPGAARRHMRGEQVRDDEVARRADALIINSARPWSLAR